MRDEEEQMESGTNGKRYTHAVCPKGEPTKHEQKMDTKHRQRTAKNIIKWQNDDDK